MPEAIPLIKQAYEADSVDEFFVGTFDEVQVAFGLKEPTEIPHRGLNIEELYSAGPQPLKEVPLTPSQRPRAHGGGGHKKNKAKNKAAKQSRKKNRRRK